MLIKKPKRGNAVLWKNVSIHAPNEENSSTGDGLRVVFAFEEQNFIKLYPMLNGNISTDKIAVHTVWSNNEHLYPTGLKYSL